MENVCGHDSPPNPDRKGILSTLGEVLPTANEPAADNAGCRGTETWLGLLNMGTKNENMNFYRPHMRLPAGRWQQALRINNRYQTEHDFLV